MIRERQEHLVDIFLLKATVFLKGVVFLTGFLSFFKTFAKLHLPSYRHFRKVDIKCTLLTKLHTKKVFDIDKVEIAAAENVPFKGM